MRLQQSPGTGILSSASRSSWMWGFSNPPAKAWAKRKYQWTPMAVSISGGLLKAEASRGSPVSTHSMVLLCILRKHRTGGRWIWVISPGLAE